MAEQKTKNILITGATGFIGRHLVKTLVKSDKYNIFCLARSVKKAKIFLPPEAKIIYTDINQNLLASSCLPKEKIDIIFHCAGYVSNKNPSLLKKINIEGTENICRLSLEIGVERMIYLSSVAVVSGNKEVPLKEDLPYRASNIYGESKIEAEKKVLEYRKQGLKAVIIRPCMVYGEDEPHVLPYLLFLLRHRFLPLIDKGRGKLHLVYVKNVVEAMIFALDKQKFLEDTFFIADNEVLSVQEVFSIFTEAIKAKNPFCLPDFLKPWLVNIPFVGQKLNFFTKDRIYSLDKIKSTGFSPVYPAERSLAESAKILFFGQESLKSRNA
ncbi:MAG: NAD(P)-dependent oxidoreductase [Candidatus Omnitrophica bacterium]|jgi:nucleoside-diphosphate-sugar epimerase|nr:NAD(P)-dependent oxidoreductase [Candidatus Omnitrophota bacterium]